MKTEEFNQVIQDQLNRCTEVLINKSSEYSTEDKLHNFRVAAALQDVTLRQALAGMMAKHTVSVYDLCQFGTLATTDMWNEKITDHINYLLLLRAVVEEESREKPAL